MLVIAVSMSEPEAGSALTDLKTKGVVRGDKVVLNGWGLSQTHHGGYAQKARVNGDWLVKLPAGIKVMTQGKPNPVIVSVVAQAAEEEVIAAPVVAAPADKTKAKKTEKQNKK